YWTGLQEDAGSAVTPLPPPPLLLFLLPPPQPAAVRASSPTATRSTPIVKLFFNSSSSVARMSRLQTGSDGHPDPASCARIRAAAESRIFLQHGGNQVSPVSPLLLDQRRL